MNRITKLKFSKSSYLLAILCYVLFSCDLPKPQPQQQKEIVKIERKYEVRLSNHIGSDWYECDSIIRVGENRIQLKNNEDSTYFIDITIPSNVILRVYPK